MHGVAYIDHRLKLSSSSSLTENLASVGDLISCSKVLTEQTAMTCAGDKTVEARKGRKKKSRFGRQEASAPQLGEVETKPCMKTGSSNQPNTALRPGRMDEGAFSYLLTMAPEERGAIYLDRLGQCRNDVIDLKKAVAQPDSKHMQSINLLVGKLVYRSLPIFRLIKK
ncbi:unnamed protein product [Protopolystoma xenopodis]|uniref:Uncharacterized protein n=1 Tax=Protopolystoma xenopodis TaxID=117903 RepID=A0A3S5C8E6_9PLAT|nr:unnamed protein product [Protopolystoma xenopodis]